MPRFRKLSPTEMAALELPALGARARVAREYDTYVADFAAGDYGRAELATDEQRKVVREGWADAEAAAYLEGYLQPPDAAYLKIPLIDIDIMAFTWSWHLFTTRFADQPRRVWFQRLINDLVLPSDVLREGTSQQPEEALLS